MMESRAVRRWVMGLSLLVVVALAGLFLIGEQLSRAAHRPVGAAPPGLGAAPVAFVTTTGEPIAGWLLRSGVCKGAVLLLHGIGADRRQMLERAALLKRLDYSVLLIDLPSHGESGGDRMTFGFREADGVRAALAFLDREFPGERIGVIGASLGAASFVLSRPSKAPAAVVLESMFPTLDDAVRDRMKIYLGAPGPLFAPLLLWQLPIRTGIFPDQVRPIDDLPALSGALLIASGTADRNTPPEEAQRLFAAAREPKELWLVEGAAHQDLYAFDRAAYARRITRFLGRYLRDDGAPAPAVLGGDTAIGGTLHTGSTGP